MSLDLSDVDPRVGQAVGGAQLLEACSAADIRRWVMAMDYPNPLHWDEAFARGSAFGGIVAPQSFVAALDCGQGVQSALVGRIPDSLLLFGGDEWWFYGHRVRPGDRHVQERRFRGYKVAETKFAGPTMFSSGDTLHSNQTGAAVARQRSTVIRYLAAEAEKRNLFGADAAPKPVWTPEALARVDDVRRAWILSNRCGGSPRFEEVEVGAHLPRRAIGPHSIVSFTTEHRAFPFNVWGTAQWLGPPGVADPWINQDHGFPKGFELDHVAGEIDPRRLDGLYAGPSRGHMSEADGSGVSLSRAFGFGASMSAWVTDYLAYWAGASGFVRHVKASFRGLALEGDVAFLDAEVAGKQADSVWGGPLVSLQVKMTNQDGAVLLDGAAEVELPL
jgi:acyl dehydratase